MNSTSISGAMVMTAECSLPGCTDAPLYAGRCTVHYGKLARTGRTRQVDAAIVAARLELLTGTYGWQLNEVAEAAGLDDSSLTKIRHGQRTRVHRRTASSVMGLPLVHRGHERVSSAGFIRRAQALARIGHTFKAQSRAMGHYPGWIHNYTQQDTVSAAVHQEMRNYYDRTSLTPGADKRCITLAIRQEFAPPFCWDDDANSPHYIDNPNATPYDTDKRSRQVAEKYERERARARGEFRLVDGDPVRAHVAQLREVYGWSLADIAQASGLTIEPVRNIAYRRTRVQRDRADAVLAISLRPPPRATRHDAGYRQQRRWLRQQRGGVA